MKLQVLSAAALLCLMLSAPAPRAVRTDARPAPPPPQDTPFDPGCTLPFDVIKVRQAIDGTCPAGGHSALIKGSQPHILQNLAKNNFCVTGAATPVGYDAFVSLQTAVNNMPGLVWGSGQKMPADRSPLRNLKITGGGQSLTVHLGTGAVVAVHGGRYNRADASRLPLTVELEHVFPALRR